MATKLVNGERMALTEQDVSDRDADQVTWDAGQDDRDAKAARKVWPSVAEFYDEFTETEQYLLQISTDAALVVARGKLSMWRGEVWNDDERITGGLTAMVSATVITETRKTEILS